MAVYTEVTDEALEAFLTEYDIGSIVAFRGIAEGVENSNYMLRTTTGDGPALLVTWRSQESAVVLTLKLWGSAPVPVRRR